MNTLTTDCIWTITKKHNSNRFINREIKFIANKFLCFCTIFTSKWFFMKLNFRDFRFYNIEVRDLYLALECVRLMMNREVGSWYIDTYKQKHTSVYIHILHSEDILNCGVINDSSRNRSVCAISSYIYPSFSIIKTTFLHVLRTK